MLSNRLSLISHWSSKLALGIVVLAAGFFVFTNSFTEVVAQSEVGLTNLVAHWNFNQDSGAILVDATGNNHGTLENNPTWTSGRSTGALEFDDNDDRIQFTTSGEINDMPAFTVAGWLYPTAPRGIILRKGSEATAARFNLLIDDTGLLTLRAGYSITSGSWKTEQPLAMNTWQHIAVTYTHGDPNSDPVFYVNGVAQLMFEKITPEGVAVADTSTLLMGNNPNLVGGYAGKIDSLRVYNKVLTTGEMQALYEAVALDSLLAHWNFDQGSGITLSDITGNDVNGTFENGPTWATGKTEGAIQFDNADDRIIFSTTGGINDMPEITLSAWLYPQSPRGIILRKGSETTAARFNLLIDDTGLLTLRAGYSVRSGAWKTQQPLAMNTWQHVAVTYTYGDVNNDPVFYVNGVAQSLFEKTTPEGVVVADTSVMVMGNNPSFAGGFDGKMDSFRVYDKALTVAEVQSLYDEEVGEKKYNFVVIVTDDQRFDTMWAMPLTRQKLFDRGVVFENSFVSTPQCCPYRTSFLSGGYYSKNTGLLDNSSFNGGGIKFAEVDANAMPVHLQSSGYKTAMIGKYMNWYHTIAPYIPPGWDRFVRTSASADWSVVTPVIGRSSPDAPSQGEFVRVEQYLTDYQKDEALRFIEESGSDPFFSLFHA